LAPFYGPAAKDTVSMFKRQHGPTINGELMAFTVEGPADHPALVPQWVSADLDLPGIAVVADGVIFALASGDRGSTLIPGAGRGGDTAADGNGPGRVNGPGRGGAGAGRGGGRGGNQAAQYDIDAPGAERDEAWLGSQRRPFEEGGQKAGTRFSGGRDTTNAVLYAFDPETGDEIYSSGNVIDSWNHYGGIAVSDGNIYVTTWDARVYAFGLRK
jgi:outer membrane protein assembly factor BamB